jgi:hypothetical protein
MTRLLKSISVLCFVLAASPAAVLAHSGAGWSEGDLRARRAWRELAGFAFTARAAPNYFDGKTTDTSFAADKPVVNGARYDDIRQTGTPTCSVLAALSAAAHSGIDLSQKIKHLGGQEYSVTLFTGNIWSDVKVSFNGWTKYDPAPNDPGEFWVALYQRAYLTSFDVDCSDADAHKWAAVRDGKKTDHEKDSQPWQRMSVALTTVTGRQAEVWEWDKDDPAATVGRIRDALAMKRCVVVGTIAVSGKDLVEDKVCLVPNHTYTVMAAGPGWILVRNPWGYDIPSSLMTHRGSKNGKDIYAFTEGYSDGTDNDPNDGIVRVGHALMKFFDYAVITK